ncbi:MAG TPA: LysM domain-containing protein [Geomonas sp.]|nr:LysM domain-containing protein [Geomonas sp.]
MRTRFFVAVLFLALAVQAVPATAQSEQPTIYTIVPGDTLWGLSKRFLNDPYYWPNMWAANDAIGNPHFIYPGQRLRVYSDRIEIEPAPSSAVPKLPAAEVETPGAAPAVPEDQQPATFSVTGVEGFIMEKRTPPVGAIISIPQNRVIVGADDIVYTDIGSKHGANAGDRFSIYKKTGAISHPVTNVILGDRVIPLGELQLSEVEKDASKAIVTKSYQEIGPGAFLLPYREKKVTVALKAADRDLIGYIVDSQTGNTALAVRDLVFLDLGRAQGVQPGNMLYIVRDVKPDQRYALAKIEKLPVDVVGAVVVLQTGVNTSTAVIVKSVDTVYRGDRVEVRKNR